MAVEQTPPHTGDIPSSDILYSIGKRVRRARERQRLTRRTLSELSGVSQRFLAHVETGTANISIVRLKAIADALDIPLHLLVSELPDDDSDAVVVPDSDLQIHPAAVATLYRRAPTNVRRTVLRTLVDSMQQA